MTELETQIRFLLTQEGRGLSVSEIASRLGAPVKDVLEIAETIRVEGWCEDE